MASRCLLAVAALAILLCVASVHAQEEDGERPSEAELARVTNGMCLMSKRAPKTVRTNEPATPRWQRATLTRAGALTTAGGQVHLLL